MHPFFVDVDGLGDCDRPVRSDDLYRPESPRGVCCLEPRVNVRQHPGCDFVTRIQEVDVGPARQRKSLIHRPVDALGWHPLNARLKS